MHSNDADLANLELSPAHMQAMGEDVLARLVQHLAELGDAPSCGDYAGIEDLCRSLREDAPEHGSALPNLLDPLFNDWIPRSFGTPGPGYMAYIPGGGVFPDDVVARGVSAFVDHSDSRSVSADVWLETMYLRAAKRTVL